MGEYKIIIKDSLPEGRYVKEQENQPPLLQTKEELIDFLIRNKAYPYCSKTGKIFFRRLKKAEDENMNFEGIIKNGAVEKLGLQTEEDCRILREKIKEELSKKREYKPTIKDWPEDERPIEMLMEQGAENLSPAKLLAIILRTGDGVKRISAEDLARNLMDCFGNFRNLDSASFSELCSVDGIGMAIVGDGRGGIFCADSLVNPIKEWDAFMQEKIKLGSFDVLMTNPPFGAKIPVTGEELMSQYALGYKWKLNRETGEWTKTNKIAERGIPPQILFIERCLQLLKPGGRMAIVLPDGILGNVSDGWIRESIRQNAKILAVVDCPPETFQPSTSTKTSVLFLQKKREDEGDVDYPIFMAVAEKC